MNSVSELHDAPTERGSEIMRPPSAEVRQCVRLRGSFGSPLSEQRAKKRPASSKYPACRSRVQCLSSVLGRF